MKKLKKLSLMSNFIFISLVLCVAPFGYAAEREKIKEIPTFEQFADLPNELQFQILLARAINDINEAQTLDEAIQKVSALRVNQNTRAIVEGTDFVSHIMPALLTLISKSEKVLQTLESLFKVPFIKAGLEELQQNTEAHNFISALLAVDSLQEPLLQALLELTKNSVGKEYTGIQFATGINLNADHPIMKDLLNNKLYQQALLSENFLQEIGIDKKSMIQQLLLHASAQKDMFNWAHVLIDHGANINLADRSTGFSPMSYALFRQNVPLLKLFLENGGKITSDTFAPMINPSLTPTPTVEQLKTTFIMKKPKIKEVIDTYADQETKDFIYGSQD